MTTELMFAGLFLAALCMAALVQSILQPERRIWPPESHSSLTTALVWIPTAGLFGIAAALGIIGWGGLPLSGWARFGLGGGLLGIGHFAVWTEVARLGRAQTEGAAGTLRTEGLYRWSRNPQYVADMAIVIGWTLFSASVSVLPVSAAVLLLLILAPFAEEPWLAEQYGADFARYRARVRRFL